MKAHFHSDPFERVQLEVHRAHPCFNGSEWMFDDLTPDTCSGECGQTAPASRRGSLRAPNEPPRLFVGAGTAIDVLPRIIDEVRLAEPASALAPEIRGLGA